MSAPSRAIGRALLTTLAAAASSPFAHQPAMRLATVANSSMRPRAMGVRGSPPTGAVQQQQWLAAASVRCCSLCAKPRSKTSAASSPPAAVAAISMDAAADAAAAAAAVAAAVEPPQPVAPVPSAAAPAAAPSASASASVDLSSLDTVHLHGMRFFSYHGVYAEETRTGQPFELDVDLLADLDEAARTDRLAATVNYAAVYECARTVLTGPPYHHLLESLALKVIDDILRSFPPVQRVAVTLRKPKVAIPGLLDYAGVSLARTRVQRAHALSQTTPHDSTEAAKARE